MDHRRELVTEHGEDPIAYATLQAGLRYLDASFGYIAYQRAFGMDITLGPPVCARADRAELAARFLRGRRRPIFCYLPADFARLLGEGAGRRLHLAGMGVDKHLDLPALSAAPPRGSLGAVRKATRAGFRAEAVDLAALGPAARDRLLEITAAYLGHSQVPVELRFLNRPLLLPGDGLQRAYLLLRRDGAAERVFGYAVLNPWFRDGRVAGYLLDMLRFEPTRLWGVFYAAVAAIARDLQAAGPLELSLGYCPLYRATAAHAGAPRPSALLEAQVAWMERRLAGVQYVRRLRELKASLPGEERPRYFASFSPLAPLPFCALMGAAGVSLRSLFGPQLWQSLRSSRQ